MELGIKGRVALVTGTGSQTGMGKAIALALAKEGCDVASVDMDFEGAQKTASEIQAMGRKSAAYKLDVSNSEDVQKVVAQVISDLGKVDILVNTAGGTAGAGPIVQAKEEKWLRDIMVNFVGSMMVTKAVLPGMIERKWGKVVNFSSAVATSGMPGSSSYAGAKAGIVTFTKCLSMEVGPSNINVNCIAPTMVLTNFGTHATMPPEARQQAAQRMTLKRLTTPEDIANTVLYLVSDMGSAMTGQCLSV